MRIITASQGTDEWRAARLGVPSGSKFSSIMAKGAGATRATYMKAIALERVTGVREALKSTFAMEQGTEREPFARAHYESITGALVEEIGFFMHDTLTVGVSPDGLVDDKGMTEYKCPLPQTHQDYMRLDKGECPSAYRWQVQGQLWIAEREWCDFASYNPDFPDNAQLIVRRVYRDDKAIKELETEVIKFLTEVEKEVSFIRRYKESA